MVQEPQSKTLPALVQEMSRLFGEREALIAGNERCTYARLAHDVQACAHGLAHHGVCPGDKVGVLMGNCIEWVVAAMAASHLGAVAVALNTWWTERELEYALDHSDTSILFATPTYLRHDYGRMVSAIQARGNVPRLRTVVGVGEPENLPAGWVPYQRLLSSAPADALPTIAAQPGDVAYILYTSGSTSHPKGVQLIHRDLVENMWQIGERQHLTEHDRLWLAVSLFWGYGCANALLTMMTHGGCIVLQESFDAATALALIEQERCTAVYGTPNIMQALRDCPDFATRDLASLRTGTTFGSPEQMRRAIGLGAQLCNVYGMTETYGNSHVTDALDPPEVQLTCVGHPLPGFEQRIVNHETEEVLPPGMVGEIRLKGRVTPGYYKDPAQTAKAFDADGFFKTNDLGMIDEAGRLHFRGRLKEIVKTGGINVSPAEIEYVLMSHPDVHLAIVIGVPDSTRDEVLGAIVVPKPGCTPQQDDLLDYCRQRLAVYKVPRLMCFANEAALPLTTTGKVQKNRLSDAFFAR